MPDPGRVAWLLSGAFRVDMGGSFSGHEFRDRPRIQAKRRAAVRSRAGDTDNPGRGDHGKADCRVGRFGGNGVGGGLRG